MFFEHLLSSEGGVKEHDEGLEHMRRVGRLLYEVQEPPKDVELLWDDDSMTLIRRRFFDGNHLLTEPREPGTLLAYITSLRMFYMFIKGRKTGVSKLILMNIETIACVDEMLARINQWGKSLREPMAPRKRVVHQENLENAMSPEDVSELICGKLSKQMVRKFMRLEKEGDANVSVFGFTTFRDYLMLRLLLASAQRPGAIANLTEQEFRSGKWDHTTGTARYLTFTVRHKTSAQGPATLFWDPDVMKMGRLYHQKLRPAFFREDKSAYGGPRTKERGKPFFLTMFGKSLSGSDVSNRIKSMARRLHPDMKGDLVGTRFRKFVVLSHREDPDPAVSSTLLARQMTHSVETADSHYYVDRGFPHQGGVGGFIYELLDPSSSSLLSIAPIPPTPPVARHQPIPPKDLGPSKPPVPTTDMSVLQKKRLLHLFVDTLTEGVCPELAMVSSTLKLEPTLVDVDPGTAMDYLKSRVTTTTTTTTITSKSVVEEHQAWLASRRPLPRAVSCSSENVQ